MSIASCVLGLCTLTLPHGAPADCGCKPAPAAFLGHCGIASNAEFRVGPIVRLPVWDRTCEQDAEDEDSDDTEPNPGLLGRDGQYHRLTVVPRLSGDCLDTPPAGSADRFHFRC